MATSKVSLKLLIHKKQQRVLFAEAGKDFIDFLFSLLVLPMGTVIRLLGDRDIVGGLAKLYKSVSDLNNDYIQPNQNKDVLLKPKSSAPFSSPKLPLLPSEAFSSSTTLYQCRHCNTLSTYPVLVRGCKAGSRIVKGLVTYMVMDDLVVSPMSTISNITLLNKFNIKDLGDLQEKVVNMGMNEVFRLHLLLTAS
ncbi:hypothetical protein HanRHA438_Chr12g0553141 [Helianthus annuus]|nr:hypothetical protein HanRHA438_Chr12g0553141 [Helianthus annuus]